jgi:hypothetical protein
MDRWQLLLNLNLSQRAKKAQFVVCDKQGLLGFGSSRPGRLGGYIGPVVAASAEIAAGIVSNLLESLAPSPQSPVFIDVPRGSPLEPWLMEQGFEVHRRLTRMVRGPADMGHSQLLFAIAGFELG